MDDDGMVNVYAEVAVMYVAPEFVQVVSVL
jgi:hypothetical protein